MEIKNIGKKAQHEIVGFILIIVIVVIIGLFLLVFYLKQEPVRHESTDIQNFLQSSMMYTTSCILSIEPIEMQDLIKSCYRNQQCLNGEMACDALKRDLKELLHGSWLVSSEKPVNSYFLRIHYEDLIDEDETMDARQEEILNLSENWENCAGSKTGAEHLIYYSPGSIIINMEICYI